MLGYVKKTLMPNEKLIFYSKPHPAIFAQPIMWIIFGLLLLIINFDPMLYGNSDIHLHTLLGVALLFIFLFKELMIFFFYISSEYSITDKRVLIKVGLIRRYSLEIFLSKIESVYVTQSITGRIFNFGAVIISGIGGSKDVFNYIPDPLHFRQLVQVAQGQTEASVKI